MSVFTQASLQIYMADCSFIDIAVKNFDYTGADECGASEDFMAGLNEIAERCNNLWDEYKWDEYTEIFAQPYDEDIDYDKYNLPAYITVSMLECDSIVFSLQYLSTIAKESYRNGDEGAGDALNQIEAILIPKFVNLFTQEEWDKYDKEASSVGFNS